VIVTQFGEPARAPILTPGLKVKAPFIQTIHRFDKRILEQRSFAAGFFDSQWGYANGGR